MLDSALDGPVSWLGPRTLTTWNDFSLYNLKRKQKRIWSQRGQDKRKAINNEEENVVETQTNSGHIFLLNGVKSTHYRARLLYYYCESTRLDWRIQKPYCLVIVDCLRKFGWLTPITDGRAQLHLRRVVLSMHKGEVRYLHAEGHSSLLLKGIDTTALELREAVVYILYTIFAWSYYSKRSWMQHRTNAINIICCSSNFK